MVSARARGDDVDKDALPACFVDLVAALVVAKALDARRDTSLRAKTQLPTGHDLHPHRVLLGVFGSVQVKHVTGSTGYFYASLFRGICGSLAIS